MSDEARRMRLATVSACASIIASSIGSRPVRRLPSGACVKIRDVAPNSRVFGADIDRNVLFSEDRIQTAYVDQMQPDTFHELKLQFGTDHYDLVIDDGLHTIAANLNTLLFAIRTLNPGGWVVIEDIWNGQICWEIVYQLIPPEQFNRHLFSFRTEKLVFALQKLP